MEDFMYFKNNFVGTVVGIYGKMLPGVVYGPAVNMPQDPVEHFVPIPGGVDGLDGTMFDPRHWTFLPSSLDHPAN